MNYSHLILDLYKCSRTLSVTEFNAHAFRELKSLVRFDSGMWGCGVYNGNDGISLKSVHLHNQPEEMLDSYQALQTRDPAAHLSAEHSGYAQSFEAAELLNSPRYTALARHTKRFDMQHALVSIQNANDPNGCDIISLWRARPDDGYEQTDSALARWLLPHVIEAGIHNRQHCLHTLNESQTKTPAHARAVATTNGTIAVQEPSFSEILHHEWSDWSGPFLPQPLMLDLNSPPYYRYIGDNICVVGTVRDNILFLHGGLRAHTGALTEAQRRVLILRIQDFSYKEIARELAVSPATVRNHLHAIYKKLNTTKITELAEYLDMHQDSTL